jgi:predicted MFS family arabinose efflux permease
MPKIPPHVEIWLSALKFDGASREALRTLSDAQWKTLLARWDLDRFQIPLRQVCGDFLPEWVRVQIDGDIHRNAARFERIKSDYTKLAAAIRGADVDHLVLKGFAQWPGYVEHPRFRRQSDLDLYCPPDSILRARDAVAGLGYEPLKWVEPGPSDHLPPMIRNTGFKWRGDFFDPELPIAVELHFRLWDRESYHVGPADLDPFWYRRVERTLEGMTFPAFHPVDGLGYLSLHVLRDLLRGTLRIHNLYELGRFLHTNADNGPFWSEWTELHEDSLRSLQAVSFRLAVHVFSCRMAEAVEREVAELPVPVAAWFQGYADSPLAGEFTPNKDLVWLQLSLLESSRDRRTVLFKKLIPSRVTSVEAPYIHSYEQHLAPPPSPLRKRLRHLKYVASRIGYHARILPPTLWHGVRWWWSAKKISRGFWTFFAASFFFNFGMYIFYLLYNLYLLDHGFKESFLGLIASASAIGGIVGTIPAGMLAHRFGLQKALLFCLATLPLICALRSLLGGEAALVALAFLGGAVISLWAVCISPAVAQLTDKTSRPFGFSLIFSSGIAIGVLGGQAAGHLPGWLAQIGSGDSVLRAKQLALLIACGMMTLAMWPISRLQFPSAPTSERKLYPRNPFMLRYLPAIAIWSLAVGGFSPFVSAFFSQHLHMPLHQIGSVFSLSQLFQVFAVLAAPVVFRKFGLVPGIVYMQIATAAGLALLAAAPGVTAAATIFIGYTAFQWMSEPGMFSLLMNRVSPAEQTGASTLNFLVINIAQAAAAAAAGASFQRFGYPMVLGVTAGVALLAACLFRLLLSNDSAAIAQTSPARLNV